MQKGYKRLNEREVQGRGWTATYTPVVSVKYNDCYVEQLSVVADTNRDALKLLSMVEQALEADLQVTFNAYAEDVQS